MRNVYGAAGLIDWAASIPVGKGHLCVRFTGGAITKFGVTPAQFATSDPAVQKIIEGSEFFRQGRIFKINNGKK